MDSHIGFLQSCDILRGTPVDVLARIAPTLTLKRLAEGEVLFREGEPGTAAYLVLSGALDLTLSGIHMLRREPRTCVGEFALIDDERRSLTAAAATDTEVLEWGRASFHETLATSPHVASGLLRVLAGKLREDVGLHVQIREAHRLKSQFLTSVAHDLRTPLNAILGYTGILLRSTQGVLDDRQYGNLENIRTSADHLLALIGAIVELSRVESGRVELRPEILELDPVVHACTTSVEPLLKQGVELRTAVAEDVRVHTDPEHLRRVLMNLLGNAVKFTESGHVAVSAEPAPAGVTVTISDTGPGIPNDQLQRIFQEFHRVEGSGQEGTGLGLAIVDKTVTMLGGSVEVESQVGVGTRFRVSLPDLPLASDGG